MMRDSFKLISGGIAISIYLTLIGIILFYFNYRSHDKPVHYVRKNSDVIAVSLAGAKASRLKKEGKKKIQTKKSKHIPKKVRNISSPETIVNKSNKAKKPAKKIKAKSLFSSIRTPGRVAKKATPKVSKKVEKSASKRVANSLKKPHNSDKGTENKYLASVEEKLRGWPEQANFAGEQIAVVLTVYSSGRFEFKIKQLSMNSEFNAALIAYLKQLQSIGLGRHTHAKPYVIEVEFEATE